MGRSHIHRRHEQRAREPHLSLALGPSGLVLPEATEMVSQYTEAAQGGPPIHTLPPLTPISVTGLEGFSKHSKVLI